jgi:hypothetical protein
MRCWELIKNADILRDFEERYITTVNLSYKQALNIVDSLWAEGVSLGVLPPKDLMEGVSVDIRIARILRSCSES